jgi:hypothetical protein
MKTNFMQTKELTDEEWMKLPKKEILQLYKNCYKMLMDYTKDEQQDKKCESCDEPIPCNLECEPVIEITDEEIEKHFLIEEPRGYGCSYYNGLVNGAKYYKTQIKIKLRDELLKYDLWNFKVSGDGDYPKEIIENHINEYLKTREK